MVIVQFEKLAYFTRTGKTMKTKVSEMKKVDLLSFKLICGVSNNFS